MNNAELIAELAKREDLSKAKTKRIIKNLVGIIRGEVQAEGRFALADLGVFTLRDRKAREQGPGGWPPPSPARKAIHFKASIGFKRAVKLK